jgi:type I restriction enzyme S subunit
MKPPKPPQGWQEVELGEACELITDYVANGSFATLKKNVQYNYNEDYAILLRLADYSNKFKGNFVYIDKKAYEFLSKSKVYPGDIILSNVGSVGSVFIAPDLNKPMSIAPNAVLIRSKSLNKFLYYLFRSKSGQDLIKTITSKTTQPKFNKTHLRGLKIPLPPLPVQKSIVSILEKAEALKKKREEADKLTKEYLQSVFAEMFGNLIKNDKKFSIRKLNEVCDVRDGTHASPKYADEGYPLITSKNISNGLIDFSQVNLISKEDFDEVNKRSKVDSGDIIMPMIGTIGNPIIIPKNIRDFAIKNVALIKFTKTDISNNYIKFILDSYYFDYITSGDNRGGTQKFIALGDIRNIPIPLPPLPLQQKFASIVEKVERLKERQKESRDKIDEMFNSLMSKAFKGELLT